VREHEAHLQQDLELADDRVALAVEETLGAVAPVEDKGPPLLGPGQLGLERVDLTADDQRRQGGDLLEGRGERVRIGVAGLLRRGVLTP
jgi:hypothetical protein